MSRVKKLDAYTYGFSGAFGKQTVFRQVDGKTTAHPRPDEKPLTEGQLAARARFESASMYARSVLARPANLAEFTAIAAHKKMKSVFMAAMTDYLSKIRLGMISTDGFDGKVGFEFAVVLKDNYKGKEMTVAVANKDGTIAESGNASFTFGDKAWIYSTKSEYPDKTGLKLIVTVKDRLDNVATFEKTI